MTDLFENVPVIQSNKIRIKGMLKVYKKKNLLRSHINVNQQEFEQIDRRLVFSIKNCTCNTIYIYLQL